MVSTANAPSIIDFDSPVANVNIDAFTGAGFQPSPTSGQLDSDSWALTGWSDGALAFGGTATTTDYARGASEGNVTTGGVYGFDVDSTSNVNRAFGFQPGTNDWVPGTVTLRVTNATGLPSTSLAIAYDVYVRNDQGRANSFNFSYSTDNVTFTPVNPMNVVSPTAAEPSPSFTLNSRLAPFIAVVIPAGGQFYLRWSGADVNGSGSRDEFALDNISVTIAAVPEASSLAFAGAAAAVSALAYVFRRRREARPAA